MSIPKEPRQLMINLMYLVLTAMLALNISSEILHAFKIINESMTKSNGALDAKNNETLLALQANEDMQGHKDRVKPYNDRAKEVHTKAAEVYNYLEDWKKKVITQAGGYLPNQPGVIKDEANIDASTLLLVEKRGGDEIKAKLNELKQYIVARISKADAKAVLEKELPLQTPNPPKDDNNPQGDWSTGTFYHVPTLGVIALMSKLQSDVRNAEAMVINQLFLEADAEQIKFDAITALAVPKTSYVLQGQQVEAQIMVAAYNKSVNPDIRPSTGTVKVVDGVGTWTGTASGVGEQKVTGTLNLNLGDRPFTQKWEFKYMVGTAGASLQLDKMNVFYIGVPNPITVTAAGYSLEDVSISIPGASLTPTGKGTYNVSVAPGGPQVIKAAIMAKTATGGKQVGGMDIRVKRIPDPVAMVDGKTGGPIARVRFSAQAGVAPVMQAFDFEVKPRIVSYEMAVKPARGEYRPLGTMNNAYFSGEAKAYVEGQTKTGDRVYIDNVRAEMPDKTVRQLNSLSFILN